MAKRKILTIQSAGENMELVRLSYIAGGKVKWYSHSGKHFCSLLYELYEPPVPHLAIYHRGMKIYVHTTLTHKGLK